MKFHVFAQTGKFDLSYALADGDFRNRRLDERFAARREHFGNFRNEHFSSVHAHSQLFSRLIFV